MDNDFVLIEKDGGIMAGGYIINDRLLVSSMSGGKNKDNEKKYYSVPAGLFYIDIPYKESSVEITYKNTDVLSDDIYDNLYDNVIITKSSDESIKENMNENKNKNKNKNENENENKKKNTKKIKRKISTNSSNKKSRKQK
jgi:hypothetical protein